MPQTTPLIPEQRRESIVGHLERERVLSYHQLTDLLGVSQMTVRRDVAVLEEQGRVSATPGGAKLASRLLVEPSRAEKEAADVAEKRAIARRAAELVHDDMTVYLDAGTTIQAMRPFLDDVAGLTVVTNDLVTVEAFLDHPSADLICVGGRVEKSNRSTMGRLTRLMLDELSLDLAFISSSSWDLSHGVTTPVEAKIDAKRAAVAASESSVLVADSSKYGRFAKYRALRLDELDLVVTDAGLTDGVAGTVRDAGVDLVVAPS
ncbi:DeoR/GlpR family DNA-binding transcription regulator [Frigoribacterium faeni]|uniref:Cytochrome c n=1 Tax=Frigoribacterium faeni TaxID=145483 RepID=A0A7W3JJ79_9MICO|nr:DeoR/GlpR family DNA-binding transcription regulator [Frigoribacterium faeni]MBA8813848.1 DeoR/GlpR family transcriptional regulator of sugar metabolism [Frigoribacterium faeni]BFF15168.1 DeoR/GlpR family DNA-binding transcription regulator [Microbacterium flavescens]GEK82178.1 cytochrome c [Frigoribacterium faeni]